MKNERGHYEIDTARIKFPYLKGMLEEREKIEENIKKCQSLIAKQVEINNTFNQLVDAQDKTEGKVTIVPCSA